MPSIDWKKLAQQQKLDPHTPAEYMEAARRLIEFAMEHWDELPDGDGENDSPDDNCQTKTDVFHIISGCADNACKDIQDLQKIGDW